MYDIFIDTVLIVAIFAMNVIMSEGLRPKGGTPVRVVMSRMPVGRIPVPGSSATLL